MSRFTNIFTDHPATVGETYAEHFQSAWRFSAQLFCAAILCLVHGILPFLFTRSGSERIRRLHDEMIVNRAHTPVNARTPTKPSQDSACAPG